MRNRNPRTGLALATLGLAAAVSGCTPSPEASPARGETPAAPAAVRVTTVKPERATIRRIAEQPGQVEAFETTPIHAKLSGFVTDLAVDIGDRIAKGQVLARLEVPEIEA